MKIVQVQGGKYLLKATELGEGQIAAQVRTPISYKEASELVRRARRLVASQRVGKKGSNGSNKGKKRRGWS